MSFDRILSSNPIDSLAAKTVSRSFSSRPESKKQNSFEEENCALDFAPETVTLPNDIDYSGRIFGDLKVVGYLGTGKWSLKCVCGKYEIRKLVRFLSPVKKTKCLDCAYLSWLKTDRSAAFERYTEDNV